MLRTTKHPGESIIIDKHIKIKVLEIRSQFNVVIGIEAPESVSIEFERLKDVEPMCVHYWVYECATETAPSYSRCTKCKEEIRYERLNANKVQLQN